MFVSDLRPVFLLKQLIFEHYLSVFRLIDRESLLLYKEFCAFYETFAKNCTKSDTIPALVPLAVSSFPAILQ